MLAHALHQQRLSQAVINFVRAGVEQVFAFQINFCATQLFRQSPRKEEGRGTPGVCVQEFVQTALETAVALGLLVVMLQLFESSHQRLRNIASTIDAKAARQPLLRSLRPFRYGRGRHFYLSFSVSRTALTKARTFSGSFFPGLASTPEATSTPQGFRTPIASPTFAGVNPPATISFTPPCRIPSAMGTALFQSKVLPVPPG